MTARSDTRARRKVKKARAINRRSEGLWTGSDRRKNLRDEYVMSHSLDLNALGLSASAQRQYAGMRQGQGVGRGQGRGQEVAS